MAHVALVTGGSRGLGFVIARRLVRSGLKVAICARGEHELDRASSELAQLGPDVMAISCDVSDASDAERAIGEVISRWGKLDLLVNNAGIIQVGPMESMSEADYRNCMDVNFWGVLNMSRAALPVMKRRGFGRIVNITSIGGVSPVPHLLPYVCSKFAAVGFSTGMATELAGTGVRVTTVVPGLMRTGSFLHALFKGDREREVLWFSLAASAPVLTISAERAASQIIDAAIHGDPWVVVGGSARVLRALFAFFPSSAIRVQSRINQWLLPAAPSSGSVEERLPAKPGLLFRTRFSRSPFTYLGDRAARDYLETSDVLESNECEAGSTGRSISRSPISAIFSAASARRSSARRA